MIRKVQGHSMVPTLPPGTLVVGLCWFISLKPGKIIIFKRDNREIIKRVNHFKENELFVVGDYPDTSTDSRHYGPIERSIVKAVVIWPRYSKHLADSKHK